MTHILVDHGSRIEEPEVDGVKPISIEPALSKIQEVSECWGHSNAVCEVKSFKKCETFFGYM